MQRRRPGRVSQRYYEALRLTTPQPRTSTLPSRIVSLLVGVGLMATPRAALAQSAGEVVAGAAVGGLLVGVPLTLAYSTARAQQGAYAWNTREAFLRPAGLVAGAAGLGAGIWAGASDRHRVGDLALGAVMGGGLGALVGRGIAELTATTPEGRWAGLTIGLGVGALVGGVTYTLVRGADRTPGAETAPTLSVSLPQGLPGAGW